MTEPTYIDDAAVPLVVPISKVAKRLGLPEPLSDEDEEAIRAAILDAQAEVEGYLGRNVLPMQFVQTGAIAYADGWRLSEPKVISIDSVVAEEFEDGGTTGRYTVTYTAGIDARLALYLPIRRYIEAAIYDHDEIARIWQREQGTAARRERSISVEGQSVSYDYLTPGGSVQGKQGQSSPTLGTGRPSLKSLDRWRLAGRRVFQRSGRTPVDRALNG